MKATITNIERVDQTVNVEVEYTDNEFATKRIFNFHIFDYPHIEKEIIEVGKSYKTATAGEEELKEKIGTEIDIE